MLVATTSIAREATFSPDSALDRVPEMLMPRSYPLLQRLMLVVSCSISSTVWMTLALDE
jgi:hypothetical protein